jgi:hypothetical protein
MKIVQNQELMTNVANRGSSCKIAVVVTAHADTVEKAFHDALEKKKH